MSGETTDYAREMAEVAKYVQKLFKKYGRYVHFDYTCGTESTKGDEFYEKWNIYTPTINHNTFKTSGELIEFIKKILKDKDEFYVHHQRRRLLEAKKQYEELLDDVEKEITLLDKSSA